MIVKTIGLPEISGRAHFGMARSARGAGDEAEAHRQAQEALRILEEIGYKDAEEVREWLAVDAAD